MRPFFFLCVVLLLLLLLLPAAPLRHLWAVQQASGEYMLSAAAFGTCPEFFLSHALCCSCACFLLHRLLMCPLAHFWDVQQASGEYMLSTTVQASPDCCLSNLMFKADKHGSILSTAAFMEVLEDNGDMQVRVGL